MPQVHLTDITIKSLKPPERGQLTYTDDALPGFGVRVSQGGVKSFVLVHTALGTAARPVVETAPRRPCPSDAPIERRFGPARNCGSW